MVFAELVQLIATRPHHQHAGVCRGAVLEVPEPPDELSLLIPARRAREVGGKHEHRVLAHEELLHAVVQMLRVLGDWVGCCQFCYVAVLYPSLSQDMHIGIVGGGVVGIFVCREYF